MKKETFRNYRRCSLSLASLLGRSARNLRAAAAPRSVGLSVNNPNEIAAEDRVPLLVEAAAPDAVLEEFSDCAPDEHFEKLGDRFVSAQVGMNTANRLIRLRRVKRVRTKKESQPILTEALPDVAVTSTAGGPRLVQENGEGVVIGVVDSGFDLSHPAFRDGNRLRVDRLLDQTSGGVREFTRQQLEQQWTSGTGPGADFNGHGTHVAGIAGGSRHLGFEGVAPGARYLLVKTDFRNTDQAVSWIFRNAGSSPCVVNLSLGHHFGPHDGTDAEERLFNALSGTGRVIVVAAGNERNDDIHIGGRFFAGESQTVSFDVQRQRTGAPVAFITLWYTQQDDFQVQLITPGGQALDVPPPGRTATFESSMLDVELSAGLYDLSNLVQIQVALTFNSPSIANRFLEGWALGLTSRVATIGRIDGWFSNSGFGRFRPHALLERHRTVGMAATAEGVLSVASHVTRSAWDSDLGPQTDPRVVSGRTSPFSSQGPTRDGRQKPDFSAPGQYLTAALAAGSELAGVDDRAQTAERLLTIEGTSMAAPMVAGVVALMLQKNPQLTADRARQILQETARHDDHTGPQPWNPSYGFGKVDLQAALARV